MSNLLKQLKKRRIALNLKQHDMYMRIGMSRQQYQNLELKGNPRLGTLALIAEGLNGEIMFIPQEKIALVRKVLAADQQINNNDTDDLIIDNPWEDILRNKED